MSLLRTAALFLPVVAAGGMQAHPVQPRSSFPTYLQNSTDYARFMRFVALEPPLDHLYQSNGFLELGENGFGAQEISVPVNSPLAPTNTSNRITALALDAPVITTVSMHSRRLEDAVNHSVAYDADRTIYRAKFSDNLSISLTVYPVYGIPAAVCRIDVEHAAGAVRLDWRFHGEGFQALSGAGSRRVTYGSPQWPYRVLLEADRSQQSDAGHLVWNLHSGQSAAILIALGGTEQKAEAALAAVRNSPDRLDNATHRRWNAYLASVPLVAPALPIGFTIASTGQQEAITPAALVRSELWFWRGVLTDTCQVDYLPASPLTIADWNTFFGMWGNDGVEEAVALAGTGRKDLARAALLNWFRYAVNVHGDGTAAWTIFPSGHSTYAATGPERLTESVPLQASLVGEYVRLTGDTSVLDEKLSGPSGTRTLWDALTAYQRHLLQVRNIHGGPFIEWLHTYETGWDDKNSPFVDLKGHATAAINEQVFQLWSLQEMIYLAHLRGEDASAWQSEFDATLAAVRKTLWDPVSARYWDLDTTTGKLWTRGENLDAYYLLYFEKDPSRIAAMMSRLNDPKKFNGAQLPTMAFDTPHWGGYWRGPAWPRIVGYVSMALARAGHREDGFQWLARAINSNLGPAIPEHVDPRAYPTSSHILGPVRIMGYDALDTLIFPDVAGLRTWGGQDLTVGIPTIPGKLYIRGQRWMGDLYDAIMEPGHSTQLWRNGQPLQPLSADHAWYARRQGTGVIFTPEYIPAQ